MPGDPAAFDRLLPLVYDELRRAARRALARESPGHTLRPTELVHEAFFKLARPAAHGATGLRDRAHFHAVAARAMRQILVEHARHRLAAKRGAGVVPATLGEAGAAPATAMDDDEELLALNDALDRLDAMQPRLRALVEHQYFGGLSERETAAVLGVSERAVQRDWARARFPDRPAGLVFEARALAALGRHSALDSLFDATRALPPTSYWSPGAAMVTAGEELTAHGDAVAGRRRSAQGETWLRAQIAVTPTERGHRYWLGSALYDLGRWTEAERVFAALARERLDRLGYRGMAALAAARTGAPGAARMLGAAAPAPRAAEPLWLHAADGYRLGATRSARWERSGRTWWSRAPSACRSASTSASPPTSRRATAWCGRWTTGASAGARRPRCVASRRRCSTGDAWTSRLP